MPRPCAVESHARHYKHTPHKNFPDATALRRGVSRSPLQKQPLQKSLRCHGLAPWSLTLAAIKAFWNHRLCDCKLSLTKTAPLLDVLTNLRASQITVAANIDTRLPEAFYPRRNERSTNL